jgi:hypothetical protein
MHDLIGHAGPGYGFGLSDELAAWRRQDRLHRGSGRWALATEILGVNSARFVLREAPEQKAILLDRLLVSRSRTRLATLRRDHHPDAPTVLSTGRAAPLHVPGVDASPRVRAAAMVRQASSGGTGVALPGPSVAENR